MAHWLIKSEQSVYSWAQFVKEKKTSWTGVRNAQAAINLKAMKVGDRCFFYHSNEGLAVVGIAEVIATAHPDSTSADPRWECVDIRAVRDMPKPVTLAAVKAEPRLAKMSLVTSMRLSVQPVTAEEWAIVLAMGGL